MIDSIFQNIYGVNGLNFAVVDDNITVQAAMAGRAQSVLPGIIIFIGGTTGDACYEMAI